MRHQGTSGLHRLAGFISLLLVAGMVGFAGSTAFAAGAQTVTIGTSLSPKDISVAPGTTVTWQATDGGRHRIRSTSGPAKLDSSDIEQGESWSFTFTRSGTYAYGDDRHKDNAALQGTVTVGTAASGTGTTPPGAPAPAAPKTAAVSLTGKAFSPASVTVAVGGTVTWTNNDGMAHNVTANGGAFRSPTLADGGVFSFTFTTPGTYAYNCTLHGGMTGTVIVPTASGSVPPPVAGAPPAPHAAGAAPPAVAAAPGKPGKHTVMVSDAGFTPAVLQARAGDTVTWVNNGQAPHTATASGGAFDLTMEPGASVSTVLQKPGTIQYVCTFHSNMTASIVVGAALPGVVVAPAKSASKKAGKRAAGGSTGPAPASNGKTKTYKVQVKDNSFSPSSVTARVGDTISWTNVGKMPHTVTAGNGSFDKTLAPGQTFNLALRAKGTVPYVCTYHPGMNGKLVVGAALAGVAVPPASANNGSSGAAGTAPAAAAPASAGKAKTIEIKVNEMSFAPAMATANVGDTISWVNVGKIPHTVTAKDGSFDKTPLAPGQRFNYVLRKEGSVNYVCTYHPGMDGMLMVGPALAGVGAPPAAGGKTQADSAAPGSPGKAMTYEIQVKDSSFTPAMQAARVGDTISWVNLGKISHTVTAKDHSFDKMLAPGQRFNLVLRKQGTIDYVCTPHPGMFGMLIVGPAPAGAKSAGAGLTIAEMPPVAMAGLGTGWILVMGLLTAAQLRARSAARRSQALLSRRVPSGDMS